MENAIIQFKDFTFKYRTQTEPTLHHIDLSINQGEKVVIVGPSGSGKSTLGYCLNGLVPFSYQGDMNGSVMVNGKETKDQDVFTLSKIIGTVLQDTDGQFIGLSVGEDIAFALENDKVPQTEMKTRVNDVADLVDMPDYLDTSLHHISGGQKQRVSLAGVMVDDVDILLFDEPLANLDPATGKHAMELIEAIQKQTNTTIVMIEHRLEDVLHCHMDRIIVMDEGKIVGDMTPDALLASSILTETHIREPLYVKALKYAGCDVTEEMCPAHLDTLVVDSCKEPIRKWTESTVPQKDAIPTNPILEVNGLSFAYDGYGKTLADISFSIHKGEMVSIVGKNGAGKSTLSKVICGFERNQTGSIHVAGENMTHATIFERSQHVGMVMQNPNHMISKHMIFDEIAFGLRIRGMDEAEIKDRVEHTLDICGLFPFRNWPITALSFGQKKRVTIASVLVLEPDIIILDEPTAGQDLRHYTDFMTFLEELNRDGMTILLITHDMHLMLEYTQRTLVLADGQLILDDSAARVLTDQAVIEQANLKETSLFTLAERAGIADKESFVSHFIAYDRGMRQSWQ
ncbi:MAG TPA: ABC transporter ATP-binding protein [Bacillota bacterium]|nr:ABC transporter ATP-binding protein [Bacillota bacterium]